MKQVSQDLKSGTTEVVEAPCPKASSKCVLIQTECSLISAGTERMLVDFGRASLIDKARQQPEKVQVVLNKIATDGLVPTIEAVLNKLEQPMPLGYSNVGVVRDLGAGAGQFSKGMRVVSNGRHAECVTVPENLCARIPDSVNSEDASFTVLGAIALQGVRLAAATLGECFVVVGLGLVGLLTVQILRANGCRVLGMDFDETKLALARQFGAETVNPARGGDAIAHAAAFSRGRGVDGVLLTLASDSSEPVSQAAQMCRKRGRIVLVGVTGLELNRADFYQKEITFQVSCSYGPGRYDPEYERLGHDYPAGYVRWTAQRNFEAVLDMMASGALNVKPLISHRFPLDAAPQAYQLLTSGSESYLGILIKYQSSPSSLAPTITLSEETRHRQEQAVSLAVIGAGNYASRVLIPALSRTEAVLHGIASANGSDAAHSGRKHGFAVATSDAEALIRAPAVHAVVIATRHDSHARYAAMALRLGKHVFVEKPLALNREQLDDLERALEEGVVNGNKPLLMVGFNRRFAPLVVTMKRLLEQQSEPKAIVVTVNAGSVPSDHWTQDSEAGGGRLIGEACHFVDLARFLVSHPIVGSEAQAIGGSTNAPRDDKCAVMLRFADGSIATVHYLANGHSSFPKERIEVFCGGRILQLDNFRSLRGYGWPGFRRESLWRQDKGQFACANAFVEAIRLGRDSPIPSAELFEVSRATVDIAEAARR